MRGESTVLALNALSMFMTEVTNRRRFYFFFCKFKHIFRLALSSMELNTDDIVLENVTIYLIFLTGTMHIRLQQEREAVMCNSIGLKYDYGHFL